MKTPLILSPLSLIAISLLFAPAACGPLPDRDARASTPNGDAALISLLAPDSADATHTSTPVPDAIAPTDDTAIAATDASPSDAEPDASGPDCGHDEMPCHGVCAQILTDGNNCGACDFRCPSGLCAGGFCVNACVAPFARCGDGCVDTGTDRSNCGGCGHACTSDQACVAGGCTPCAAGLTLCGNECVDLQRDPDHCGACGSLCDWHVCAAGTCERCPSGEAACGGRCVDVHNDPNNCLVCGHHCRTGETCSDGECQAFVPVTPPLYGRCYGAAQCGTGRLCDMTFPHGLCTQFCSTDAECGSNGTCAYGVCRPACTEGGNECDTYSGSCSYLDDQHRTGGYCVPQCGRTTGCGFTQYCNIYSGECVSNSTARSGFDDGAACAHDGDCLSGWCIPEIDGGHATGFLNGYCASVAVSPDRLWYQWGEASPLVGCPVGASVVSDPTRSLGDTVMCGRTCTSDGDCRSGYSCDHSRYQDLSFYFTNGVCVPTDCAVPGTSCPAGTHCNINVDSASRAIGTCVR